MKKIMTTEFKVGLTIILATLILIFGIIWGKEFRFKTNKYQMRILFDKVGGLVKGDPVTVNGVKEGKVLKIDWQGRRVLCTVELNDHVQLYEDATFTITSAEILAGMKIEIFPGKSDRHINFSLQPFSGKYGGRIVDVGLTIGKLANDMSALSYRIDTTVIRINKFLAGETLQRNVNASLSNLNKASASLTLLPKQVGHTLNHLDTAIIAMNMMVKQNKKQFGKTVENLSAISTKLDTVSGSLKNVMSKIENRQGTLGKLVNDTTLYNNLSRTLLRVDSLAKQIKDSGLDLNFF